MSKEFEKTTSRIFTEGLIDARLRRSRRIQRALVLSGLLVGTALGFIVNASEQNTLKAEQASFLDSVRLVGAGGIVGLPLTALAERISCRRKCKSLITDYKQQNESNSDEFVFTTLQFEDNCLYVTEIADEKAFISPVDLGSSFMTTTSAITGPLNLIVGSSSVSSETLGISKTDVGILWLSMGALAFSFNEWSTSKRFAAYRQQLDNIDSGLSFEKPA